jgi:hypothetical protein
MVRDKEYEKKSLLAAGIPLGQRRSERTRVKLFDVKALALSKSAVKYAKKSVSPQFMAAVLRYRRNYAANPVNKVRIARTEKKSKKKYRASDHGKAVEAAQRKRARARIAAAIKAAAEEHQRWLASLTPEERQRALDEEEAIKAVEKAMKRAESRIWGGAKIFAVAVCAALAAKLENGPAWLRSIFARKKVGNEIICEDGGCADSAIKVKACKGLIIHASNVGPYALDLVDDEPYMLRPAAKWSARVKVPFVYGTASNDPAEALQFVEAHKVRDVRKCFVSLARDAPASHSVFLYVLDQHHAQYDDFHQLFVQGGLIVHCMRFFARCRRPVNVAPGTPGVAVLRIFWKEGAPMDPHVEVVYGQVEIPTMPLPQCIAELRAMYAREQARAE